jgi:hypothetical protein
MAADHDYKTGRLKAEKYKVTKTDGTPCDSDAKYFVLRIDSDPNARAALRTYAYSVSHVNKAFGLELVELLKKVSPPTDKRELEDNLMLETAIQNGV